MTGKSIDDEVREIARANCDHICHRGRPLNPWVETCPVCGCPNPRYTHAAETLRRPPADLSYDDPSRLRAGRRWVPREGLAAEVRREKILADAAERRRAKLARRAERHRRSEEGRHK